MEVLNANTGTLLCQWTWAARDWASDPNVGTTPEPAATPCTDADGNACAFSFAVNLSEGVQTSRPHSFVRSEVQLGALVRAAAEEQRASLDRPCKGDLRL